jgi:hypothetical protein
VSFVEAVTVCGKRVQSTTQWREPTAFWGRLLLDVGAQLGHNGSRMTELYAHLFDPELIEHGTPMADAVLSARDKVSGECAKNVRNSKKSAKRSTRRKAGYAGVS